MPLRATSKPQLAGCDWVSGAILFPCACIHGRLKQPMGQSLGFVLTGGGLVAAVTARPAVARAVVWMKVRREIEGVFMCLSSLVVKRRWEIWQVIFGDVAAGFLAWCKDMGEGSMHR